MYASVRGAIWLKCVLILGSLYKLCAIKKWYLPLQATGSARFGGALIVARMWFEHK